MSHAVPKIVKLQVALSKFIQCTCTVCVCVLILLFPITNHTVRRVTVYTYTCIWLFIISMTNKAMFCDLLVHVCTMQPLVYTCTVVYVYVGNRHKYMYLSMEHVHVHFCVNRKVIAMIVVYPAKQRTSN